MLLSWDSGSLGSRMMLSRLCIYLFVLGAVCDLGISFASVAETTRRDGLFTFDANAGFLEHNIFIA